MTYPSAAGQPAFQDAQQPEPSTGELISRLSADLSTLVRDEMRLAQLEMTAKAKKAGLGAGLFGTAGILAWFGFGAFVAAAILGIATALDGWLAAVIVGAALMLAAGIAALAGRKEVTQAIPAAPEEAISGVKTDVQTVKEAAHR